MKRSRAVGAALLLLATACSDSSDTTTTAESTSETTATTAPATTTPTVVDITGTFAPVPTGTTEPPGPARAQVEVVQDEFRRVTLDDPPLDLVISIPRIDGIVDPDVAERANQYLLDDVTRLEKGFVRDVTQYFDEVDPEPGPISFLEVFYEVGVVNPGLLSMHFDEISFFQGAAGVTHSIYANTIDLETGEMLFLGDLFIGTEWAFALDALVRQAIADTYFQGDLAELDAYYEPDDLVIPEDFVLQPFAFRFWMPEVIIGAPVFQPPDVRLPYWAIGVYIGDDTHLGELLIAAELPCTILAGFEQAQDEVFTLESGSTAQAEALDELRDSATDLGSDRPDLAGAIDTLASWATAFVEDSQTQLTAADRDAIEASNDILRAELDLCP